MLQGTCHCGNVKWTLEGMPEAATACNCSVCRRYGVLWAYDYDGEGIKTTGETAVYSWGDKGLGFHFCRSCGCTAYWRALEPDAQGRRRIAVNLRLAEPDHVAQIPVRHFDGLDSFQDLPRDDRCVKDYWA